MLTLQIAKPSNMGVMSRLVEDLYSLSALVGKIFSIFMSN